MQTESRNPYTPPTTQSPPRKTSWLGYLTTALAGLVGILFCAIIGACLGMALMTWLPVVTSVDASYEMQSNLDRGLAAGFWVGASLGLVRVLVLMYHKVRSDSVREREAEAED